MTTRPTRNSIDRMLVCIAALVAIIALAGKATHGAILQAWSAHTVSMKETTAWLVIEHCWAGFIVCGPRPSGQRIPVFFIAGFTLLLGIGLAWEIRHSPSELASFDPLKSFYPSVVTVASMCLLALKALAALAGRPRLARAFSCAVSSVGACALLGYTAGLPAMYFFIPGYTTAMAMNTAFCLFLLGLVSVCASDR